MGVQGENNLAIWDLKSGLVVRSCLIKNTTAVNAIAVDPYVGGIHHTSSQEHLQFSLCGNKGLFNIYRYELSSQLLQAFEVDNVPAEFQASDFTSVAYTQITSGQQYYAVLGASDGSMTAYDLGQNVFVEGGMKRWCISGEIGQVKTGNGQMVVASSTGSIARWAITPNASMFPTERA